MSQVMATRLPAGSELHALCGPADFLDCYSVASTLGPRPAAEIVVAFPPWVHALLRLRHALTAPFGLSQSGPAGPDMLGPFPVLREDAGELVAGFDDRHLDFRISLLSEGGRIHLATWVHTHNPGGRLYLMAVMPFHILVARNALARVAAAG
ncbi:DUF2867 domain-containing protein [Jannaschia sp. S6380]|uniref:DUF2867 domain-containing protein n=1 Tax=Jannaschia sp. S6380 TaxID=2926408 RepID=UPI001FF6E918|nr:DUF2867 domain-containing protein [Jannaschia sp. S6380]MCK0167028.1 DUF2867 domain-containing protein [Jannaschia sp. S6380]